MHWPEAASQILTVRSLEADASRSPLLEKTTDLVRPRWTSSVWRHAPEAASQILTVRSPEADASRSPLLEKTTDLTRPLWPSNVWRHAFQSASMAGFVVIQSGSSA